MKHLSFADKSLFLDDESADLLLEYAGLLASERSGDTVTVRAVGPDGNEVDATFVLNSATNLIAESTNSDLQPPSNPEAADYMRQRIELLRNPPSVTPEENAGELSSDAAFGDQI
ncbi:hypothetical protein ACFUTX_15275 [Microbacterium sp. NPDC057407]|uniref:hypothetical protein n=1 Tax=Microbacterium sp. NPDC057407 TaxID=3346120 RepID=UPI00366A7911